MTVFSPLPERVAITSPNAAPPAQISATQASAPQPDPREPAATLRDAAPAVSPTIRLDPPTGLVVTRWYQGEEVLNQIPTTRQLEAYRFGAEANGMLRGAGNTGTIEQS